jgi:hypothetical protein
LEAIPAINRFVAARLKWHFCRSTAAAASCTEHLTRHKVATFAATLCSAGLAGLPAVWASIGFILEALLRVEFLLACCECKLCAAIDAGK